MPIKIDVNKEVIKWAIERAGLTLNDVPEALKWINEGKKPTIKQLEKFSKKVHIPFGFLLLNEPVKETIPIPLFRKGQKTDKISLNLYDMILILQQRQEWLKEFLQENDYKPLSFVGKYKSIKDYKIIAEDIRKTLGLSENWTQELKNKNEALNFLTKKAALHRIIVVFNGVVGNNPKRKIPVEECRGFVLVDDYAPFMFINNNDFLSAQLFTFAHELAHIWIGKSAGFDFRQLQPANDPIEKLCDKVAAEVLVPENLFINVWNQYGDIYKIARYFKVSPLVIARRALDTQIWERNKFFKFYEEHKKKIEKNKSLSGSGGNFYAIVKKRINPLFGEFIKQALDSGKLLYTEAYELTGLKGKTLDKFLLEIKMNK